MSFYFMMEHIIFTRFEDKTMGDLGYAPCIYDNYYPCYLGCDNRKCKYWYDENVNEEENESTNEE